MKKIHKLITICLFALFLANCEDNEKYPLPVVQEGAFVLVDITSTLIDVTQIESSAYAGRLQDTRGNIDSHTFEVRSVVAGVASDYVPVYTTTTFPAEFAITAGDIAAALGVDIATFPPGTRFDFVGKSTTDNGDVVTFNSLNADLQAELGQRQAYNLQTFISCPVSVDEIAGTYLVQAGAFRAFFGETTDVRTVVAGPGSSQITIVEGEYTNTGGDPLILDIDFSTGIITGGGKDADGNAALAWAEGVNGLPENTYLVEGGFFFSCVGVIDLQTNFSPFNGNSHRFQLQKQ
ncbi:hypothetical protein ACFSQJ_19245 [Croceitalea marina]|uniref:DUF1735 domain-containing protein n=1 Tax=Croceitalea marina TaxID=1775166 RepID=A0ABW5N081_9FLAO